MKLYRALSLALQAIRDCEESGNEEWRIAHTKRLHKLVSEHMPSGAGVDNGTTLDLDRSEPERLVFVTSFHHMNDNGVYDGWTEHTVTAKPSFPYEVDLKVSGQNRNDIKSYLHEIFADCLTREVKEYP